MSPGLIVIIILVVVITLIVKNTKGKNTIFADVPAPDKQSSTSQKAFDNSSVADNELTMPQKYAAMGILFFFYGFCHDTPHAQQAQKIIENLANVLKVSKEEALEYCNLYLDNDDKLMEQIKHINSISWQKYIMRECYKLAQFAPSAKPIFFAMAQETGLSLIDITNS